MDVYQKITGALEPLGGEMLLEAFAEARRAALARSQAAAAAAMVPKVPDVKSAATSKESEADRSAATMSTPLAIDATEPSALDDTGKLRLEIQEFLRERSGFDPTQNE
jgi:hypothetical protein